MFSSMITLRLNIQGKAKKHLRRSKQQKMHKSAYPTTLIQNLNTC